MAFAGSLAAAELLVVAEQAEAHDLPATPRRKLYLPPISPSYSLTILTIHTHAHNPLTMATQRLSNVLSHITPGKTPLEQMYAPVQTPPHFFPQIDSTLSHGNRSSLADSIPPTAPHRIPTMLSSHLQSGHP